ncbi:MAG: hypothetical protein AAF449_21665, partial [Myxococcota bacterium]
MAISSAGRTPPTRTVDPQNRSGIQFAQAEGVTTDATPPSGGVDLTPTFEDVYEGDPRRPGGPSAPAPVGPVADPTPDVDASSLPGFDLRFPEQDAAEVRSRTATEVRDLVGARDVLLAEGPSADRDALLRQVDADLQRSLSHYALAGGDRAGLERVGALPEGGYEIEWRAAEAFRRGGDSLAQETFEREGFQAMEVTEAAARLRELTGDERTD